MQLNPHPPLDNDIGFINRYISNSGRRYVYGRTKEAENFIKVMPCDFVIDDFTEDKRFCGKDIVRLNDVVDGASVLSAVMHSPVSIYNALRSRDLDFSSYYWVQKNENIGLEELDYWKGVSGHFSKNRSRYDRLFKELYDAESRRTLSDVLSFRETGNLRNMLKYSNRLDEMYFESFVSLPENASFYDLGALDGKNSLDFIKICPDFSNLVIIEPLPECAEKLRDFWCDKGGVVYECAISSEEGVAGFSISDCSAASSLHAGEGGVTVKVKTIDGIYSETKIAPSFIKMDIEGAEIDAIKGGCHVLKTFAPAIAVSVYHNPDHILEAYEILKQYVPEYKFYMRHYTEGFAETVLFAVV